MKYEMKRTCGRILAVVALVAGMATLAGCNPEPDESDLYTATGETAADYIKRKSELTSFDYILTRVRLDRNLSSYGEYTVFAPSNEAIAAYIDSLYNDTECPVPHNSMTENSLEGLSDSLCNDIARYHRASGIHNTIELGGGGVNVNTMLGTPVTTEGTTDPIGRVTINNKAVVIQPDSLVTNGVVHVLNNVIPRSTRVLVSELERHEEYSIFVEALKMTGLADSLTRYKKDRTYTISDNTDTSGEPLYSPEECKIAFTIFAEPDVVMKENGINSIEDLIAYANRVYGGAAAWYDYPAEKGIAISTGNDYTNRFNALNMFVAYHILYAGMPETELVYEYTTKWLTTWNYVNGGEPYDYYETMLPHTILKLWQPQPGKKLYINRYQTFNTLTDQLASYGSQGMHSLVRQGVRVARSTDTNLPYPTNIMTFNGYIHGIRGMLVYDDLVPKGVLHERMRFDSETFLPELINNGFRTSSSAEISVLNGGGSGARVAFPLDYFDNVVSYTSENRFRTNVRGAYNAYQSDCFQGWGNYDLAVKMPPLPTGTYEFRLYYAPMSHGGMMQFYMGTSSNMQTMMALDIPLDVRIDKEDPRIGWTDFTLEDDQGVATDEAMRNRGYMRGPYGFKDHAENNESGLEYNMRRGHRNAGLRRILGRLNIKQSDEHWFRFKSVLPDETDLKWQLDFVEFVPIDVVDNDTYSEDWY